MHLTTTRDSLLPLLETATRPIRANALPILTTCLLQGEGEALSVTGTDLETQIVASGPLAACEQSGAVCVAARKLLDITRLAQAGDTIHLRQDGERLLVRHGRSRYTLQTLPASDYPTKEPEAERVSIDLPAALLLRGIDRVAFAMARNDVRYYLNALAVTIGPDHITTTASDGHRLARQQQPLADGQPPNGVTERPALLPAAAVATLRELLTRRLKGDPERVARLWLGQHSAGLDLGPISFTTKLIAGVYPDVDRIIPRHLDTTLLLSRDELAAAIGRVLVVAEQDTALHLTVSAETINIVAANPEGDRAEDAVTVASRDGADIDIAFNGRYLADALAALASEHVTFAMSHNAAALHDPEDAGYIAIVMPMRT